jgi:lysyl-tRNA synthetase class 2
LQSVFYQGVELANGYHELADAREQRRRLNEANQKRISEGRKTLPPDEYFLSALEKGIPDCCGVAVGFDRLMMLHQGSQSLAEILPFSWQEI